MLDIYLKLLDLGYYEAQFAFEGLCDENVWKRPAEGLLSVGEQAGHVAFWEAVKYAGEGKGTEDDLTKCRVQSPLIDRRFRYYYMTLASKPSDEQLAMTAEQVWLELSRVHGEVAAHLRAQNPDLNSNLPGYGNTYADLLEYSVFHIAYHVGQMYSVRHLLGEKTPDN